MSGENTRDGFPEIPTQNTDVEGERGVSMLSRARSMQSRAGNMLALGFITILGVGLLVWYYTNAFARNKHIQEATLAAAKNRAQSEMRLPALGPIDTGAPRNAAAQDPVSTPSASEEDPLLRSQELAATMAPLPLASSGPGSPSSYPGGPPAKTPAQLALERQLAGPSFAKQSEAFTTPGTETSAGGLSTAMPDSSAPVSGTHGGELVALLTPSVTPAASARVLPTQRLLLSKGAFIDCTLETAIDSTLPGMTTCITATDTFSVDGKVVLLERGTKLVGETRGEVEQGAARVFVLWTEARTPTGVVIPLASPGTDELGRSGLPGQVNRHFWDRFGAAILISVIDGGVEAASNRSSSGGAIVYNPSASSQVMSEVLKGTLNIRPTVVKNNGDRIQVFVARDLDFRPVYELHATSER
jgi:type IV secretion system protein VirB10